MFDLIAEEFKEKIVTDVNESGLPLTAVAYILQEVLHQVSVLAQQQIAQQKQQRDAEESADKEQ
jgi:hypothetical protein